MGSWGEEPKYNQSLKDTTISVVFVLTLFAMVINLKFVEEVAIALRVLSAMKTKTSVRARPTLSVLKMKVGSAYWKLEIQYQRH